MIAKDTHCSIVNIVNETPRPLAAAKMNNAITMNIMRWKDA